MRDLTLSSYREISDRCSRYEQTIASLVDAVTELRGGMRSKGTLWAAKRAAECLAAVDREPYHRLAVSREQEVVKRQSAEARVVELENALREIESAATTFPIASLLNRLAGIAETARAALGEEGEKP